MIYQDVYSGIKSPISMYDIRKQVDADRLAEQQKQLALQQKEQEGIVYRGQLATQALVGFKALSSQQKPAQWNAYRQRIESLVPETKGILPSVWDSNDPSYEAELDSAIGGLSKTYFKPEQTKLGAEETLLEGTFGVAPKQIARGAGKSDEGYDKLVDIEDVDPETGQPIKRTERRRKNDEGFWQSGSKVYPDEYPQGVEKEAYYKAFGITPKSKSAVNSLAVPPSEPMAIPGQAELPPRQFNTPSPTNRAGETNVGYGIDENAMLQQPQIMPSMGNMMLRGAGAVMADEFAPQPRNALVGGMMPQPSRFAELMPAGSAPNRFGSPGVEGIDFAATGGQGPVDARGIPLSAIGSARPRYVPPNVGQPRETFRDMTPAEISASGRDPARFSGQISSLGQKKFEAVPSVTASEIEELQRDKLRAEAQMAETKAKQEKELAKKNKQDAVSLLRGIKRIEMALGSLKGSPFFDTGTVDQFFMAKTDKGKELVKANDSILSTVKRLNKTPGEGAFSNLDVDLLKGQLPDLGSPMSSNMTSLQQVKTDILALYGVQSAVSNKAERDALPPGTTYVDINTGMRYQKGEK
jgi:hypothetical protein